MIHDQYFTEYIKMDGPLSIPSTRMRRRPDGLSPRYSSSRTPGKTPNIERKTPDVAKTPGKLGSTGKTPTKPLVPQQRGPWKTPSKTPNKGLKLNQQDRFIPTRSSTDIDAASFAVSKPEEDDEDRQPSQYEMKLSEAMNVAKECKILSFQAAKPKPADDYVNKLKVVYSQKVKKGGTQKPSRVISNVPERILDAPEVRDDYYLNLMDWSCSNQIAVGLGNGVYLWNADTGKILHLMAMESEEEYVSCVKWIGDGNYLAVGTSVGAVELWDVEDQKLLRTMQGHAARIGSLSWNSYICSSGSRTGSIHHHDVRIAEHQVAVLTGHTQEVCGLSWSPDGRYLASGGNDNVLHIWNRELGTDVPPQQTHTYHQAAVKALAWCPWRPNLLASGGGTADRHIRLWDINLATLVGGKDTGSQLYCGGHCTFPSWSSINPIQDDKNLTLSKLKAIADDRIKVCSILFSKEHKEVISGHGYSMNQLSIWKYPDFQHIKDLMGHRERILGMSMSPDGSMVASIAADQTIRIWKCFETSKKESVALAKTKKESSALLKPSVIR